jgi:hypothetical protein
MADEISDRHGGIVPRYHLGVGRFDFFGGGFL